MKKKFKDTKFAKIAGSVLKGALMDTTLPFVGLATGAITGLSKGLQESKKSNLEDDLGGVGQTNYLRLAVFGATVILAALLIFGVIDKETFEYLLEVFSE